MQFLREDLLRIDECWIAARFDSLPHVVHILTSKDRDAAAQFLKEQSDIIEDVVDEVVHSYHSGFNRAIQNYSQVSLDFVSVITSNIHWTMDNWVGHGHLSLKVLGGVYVYVLILPQIIVFVTISGSYHWHNSCCFVQFSKICQLFLFLISLL